MTGERKTELPLKLDIGFAKVLARLVRVKPKEVADSVEQSNTKKPPGDSPRRSAPTDRKRKPEDGG